MILTMLFFIFNVVWADATEDVVVKMQELSTMREMLAGTLNGRAEPITEQTFKEVCAPVGKNLKSWAEVKGYSARQVSEKYRNPQNAPTRQELAVLARFSKSANLDRFIEGSKVFVPIRVTQACLHCHGEKERRPEFVKQEYPGDRAFGFKSGDLRGMYAIEMK